MAFDELGERVCAPSGFSEGAGVHLADSFSDRTRKIVLAEYRKGAVWECVIANKAPSQVNGNPCFDRFLSNCINALYDYYIIKYLEIPAHGILSFDLKEDKNGNLKVTEAINRHMADAGVMAHMGFDRIGDAIGIPVDGDSCYIIRDPYHSYEKPYIFLRDVNVEPIVPESEEVFDDPVHIREEYWRRADLMFLSPRSEVAA